jgi:hypothetical protein
MFGAVNGEYDGPIGKCKQSMWVPSLAQGLFPYDIRVLLPWLQRLRGAFEG